MYSHTTHPKLHTSGLINVKPGSIFQSPNEARTARISSVYREKQPVVHDYIGPTRSLREHILGLSLFPNGHNKAMLRSGF